MEEANTAAAAAAGVVPHGLSHAQAAFFMAYATVLFLWLLSEYCQLFSRGESCSSGGGGGGGDESSSSEALLAQSDRAGGGVMMLKQGGAPDISSLKGGAYDGTSNSSIGNGNGSDAHMHHHLHHHLGHLGHLGHGHGQDGGGGGSAGPMAPGGGAGATTIVIAGGSGSNGSNGNRAGAGGGKHAHSGSGSGPELGLARSPSTLRPPGSGAGGAAGRTGLLADMLASPAIRCLMLDKAALRHCRPALRAMAEFGALMVWYYICDRTSLLGSAGKSYSRDLFLFLFLILTLVAMGASMSTVKTPVLLVRQQTEEWKGWMQVLFLLYHYYEAKEYYNAIRIFIACYVWMTGFGNFIYYHKTSDFSLGRFAQMMWRLNFLVIFACVVLRNSYMLYYICPMHTLFTIMVYACLGIASHLNQSKAWVAIKVVICWLVVQLLWHKPVFYALWSPFTWMVGYLDPRKPDFTDAMHEWFFRSSLDRYVWIYGMVCGALHPAMQQALYALDSLPRLTQAAVRTTLVAGCLACGYLWYVHVYTLPRNEYNQIHPYTSWIPITLWAVLRNLTPPLRLHHLRLYGWLGCITLETYICQFHVWMRTDLPDGQPKALLVLLPGYPLLNFALVTALYIFISHRLFELTNTLKTAFVPHSNDGMLLRNGLVMLALGAGAYALGAVTLTQISRAW